MDNDQPRSFPILHTNRLKLRDFTLQDAPAVFDELSRKEVNQWMETELLHSVQETEQRLTGRINLFKDGMGFRWAIALINDPGRAIGSCGFFHVRRGTRSVEMGYDLHPDYWNRGFMTEALQAVLGFTFSPANTLPVHRIEALVAPGNLASIRVLEKLGFTREGLRREFFYWDDRYQDVYMYALLGKE